MTDNPKNVLGILERSEVYLREHGVDQPRLIAELLLSRLLKTNRAQLALHFQKALPEAYLEAMRRGLKRAGSGEPVQYVLGETGFMNHTFKTDRRALIPRPETEALVRLVLECTALWAIERPAIADIGTGSGCIVLSLAAARPQGRYLAMDLSEEAIELARVNADQLELTDRVIFTTETLSDLIEAETLDAITANLPYIPSGDIESLPRNVRDHEPVMALDGGPSGLDIITDVIEEAAIALKNKGWLFLEIGEKQGRRVTEILQSTGFLDIQIHPDLNGRDRVAVARLSL